MLTEVPGAPEKLTVAETSKSSIKLTWAVPGSDGGTPVTGYQIERCLADSTRWIRVGRSTETSYADKEVVEDTTYLYRVIAENKVGPGPPCEPTQPVTAKDPWSESLSSCSSLKKSSFLRCCCYTSSVFRSSAGRARSPRQNFRDCWSKMVLQAGCSSCRPANNIKPLKEKVNFTKVGIVTQRETFLLLILP